METVSVIKHGIAVEFVKEGDMVQQRKGGKDSGKERGVIMRKVVVNDRKTAG